MWQDTNRNGLQDVGEPGIPGVTMTATWRSPIAPSATQTFTTTTGPNGDYRFVNLPQGAYTVQTGPFDWETHRFSPVNQGTDDTRDSDFRQIPCAPATEGKDIVGTVDTTLTSSSAVDLDGGVYPVL